jgi:N6-L-threonylcarbamoyladenine synthase
MAGERDEIGVMKAVPRWPMDTLEAPSSAPA